MYDYNLQSVSCTVYVWVLTAVLLFRNEFDHVTGVDEAQQLKGKKKKEQQKQISKRYLCKRGLLER